MRGKQAPKRKINADQIYGSTLVTKLINYVMVDGKKEVAQKVVYKAMEDAAEKAKGNAIEVLEKAIENIKPKVEVRSKRVGGSNFQVPVPVKPERQQSLAIRWMVGAARDARGSGQSWQSLSREIVNSFKKEGTAFKKKEEVQRMAEANKAFSQFA